jgi:hypothetical protein
MRKSTVVILNQLNIKNNKINKDNFEKNHKKKLMWKNIVAIYNVLKKKTTKLNFQPTQYEKTNRQRQFRKKKKTIKKIVRKNNVVIHNVLKKKITKLNSQPTQY